MDRSSGCAEQFLLWCMQVMWKPRRLDCACCTVVSRRGAVSSGAEVDRARRRASRPRAWYIRVANDADSSSAEDDHLIEPRRGLAGLLSRLDNAIAPLDAGHRSLAAISDRADRDARLSRRDAR
jgi:hypothetical protein